VVDTGTVPLTSLDAFHDVKAAALAGVTLIGVAVLVSTDVAAGNAWGLDGSQVFVVQRTGTKVVRSTDAAFDYDAVQVRATAPVPFGFANPAGVVRLYDSA
jgi:hypothetical protein